MTLAVLHIMARLVGLLELAAVISLSIGVGCVWRPAGAWLVVGAALLLKAFELDIELDNAEGVEP